MKTSRSFDFTVLRADSEDDGLTLEGYASVFDTPTEIYDHMGAYTETVARGAFTKTLSERTPVLQFDHGRHPMIGSIPLGVIQRATEDEHGLFVRARLSDNWLVQPVREAIRDGAITGMSFQFEVLRDDWNDDSTERTIREVKLYEVGPVVYPAYETTTVGVRSEIQDLLADENVQSDLARALLFPDAATRTSEENDDTPPERAPVVPDQKAAEKAGRLAALIAAPSDYVGEPK
jgi:HK97 family phage prohead protease